MEPTYEQAVAVMLSEIGIRGMGVSPMGSQSQDTGGTPVPLISPLPGGGNNKVFRVDCDRGSFLLKAYFRHPDDPRDRLGTEYSFLRFAWDAGLRCVPQPLACDRELGLGLYEFALGRPLKTEDVTVPFVEQAIGFVRQLNQHRLTPAGRALAKASEACFSIDEHLRGVERRIRRLDQLDRSTPTGDQAAALVAEKLLPASEQIRSEISSQCAAWNLDVNESLAVEDRILSPSDFGFHNSLMSDGRLTFIDFEYAGWDDPAKTVADFFSQPDVLVPLTFFEQVSHSFVAGMTRPQAHLRRISLLFPLYRLKWCCIMLNEFLPMDSRRRSFAKDPNSQEQRRQTQLGKVRLALQNLHLHN